MSQQKPQMDPRDKTVAHESKVQAPRQSRSLNDQLMLDERWIGESEPEDPERWDGMS